MWKPALTEQISVSVNGIPLAVPKGTTVAVAVLLKGASCRKSVTGQPRGPLCGMGICFECRVEISGTPHCRSCQIVCEPGMGIRTHE
jgi:sarcosine oxidase subunit alpha